MTECSMCGGCCDPVALPMPALEAAALPGLPARDRHWLLNELKPMARREAMAKRPELAPFPYSAAFYSCTRFDPDTRLCTAHDDLPSTCRNYPWDGKPPRADALLPPACSFRADVGQPIDETFVPVQLTRRNGCTITD